jgi:hypothetical protein
MKVDILEKIILILVVNRNQKSLKNLMLIMMEKFLSKNGIKDGII